MKVLKLSLLWIIVIPILTLSQTMIIHQKDGTVRSIDLNDIDSISFSQSGGGAPCPGIATVEFEGQIYNTVQIGNQCWFRENLNVGTMITTNSEEDNQHDNNVLEKYCYANDEANCNIYGGLYQWDEAMQYDASNLQGICPEGWRIPTNDDFHILEVAVNGSGNSLKAIGEGEGAGAGTNISGFSALIAGERNQMGGGFYDKQTTSFWSSTGTSSSTGARYLNLTKISDDIFFYSYLKKDGYSIRCLKN